MKKWTRPVFETFDVNGEATAYAGAVPAETIARPARSGEDRGAGREAAAVGSPPGVRRAEGPAPAAG